MATPLLSAELPHKKQQLRGEVIDYLPRSSFFLTSILALVIRSRAGMWGRVYIIHFL